MTTQAENNLNYSPIGPVIGPMALAGCLIDESLEDEFKKLGIKDSKQITPKKRAELAKIIKERALTFEITLTFPNEITEKNTAGVNLNTIEAQKSAEIINRINKGRGKIAVYIDTPSPNIPAWQKVVESYINNTENLEMHCEHKADVNHVCASAASILAKTTRDGEIEKIREKVGVDFGSGYPSDPLTCKFLKDYSEKYKGEGIFRETWGTWKDECKRKAQKRLDGF